MRGFFETNIVENSFQQIYRETFDEYYSDVMKDMKNNKVANVNPIDLANEESPLNNLVIKPMYSKEAKYLKSKYHTSAKRSKAHRARILYGDSVISIDKIDSNITIEEAIPIIKGIRENLQDKFFGVILRKNGASPTQQNASINPLNPIVASAIKSMIDDKENKNRRKVLDANYSIIVYSLKDSKSLRALLETKPDTNYMDDIQKLMIVPNLTRGVSIEYDQQRRAGITTATIRVTEKDSNGKTIESDSSHFVVPVQLANVYGVMYPSYGAVLFQGRSGMNMTPFHSANVGSPYGNGNTWSNVCTGSLNSSTDAGKASLNHSNNTSPLNNINICEGAIQWAHGCVDMSLQLLLGEEVEVAPVFTGRMTKAQYVEQNPGTGIKEYIEHVRELNAKELPEW